MPPQIAVNKSAKTIHSIIAQSLEEPNHQGELSLVIAKMNVHINTSTYTIIFQPIVTIIISIHIFR